MNRMIAATALVLASLAGTAVQASDDRCNVPAAEWQTREALQQRLESEGWTVARIKTDDGCYEVHARDPQGRRVEIQVDPRSLEIVRLKSED